MTWSATPARRRALAVAVTGCTLALLTRRPDLVVLVSPFVLVAVLDWRPPDAISARVRTRPDQEVVREGTVVDIRYVVTGMAPTASVVVAHRPTDEAGPLTTITVGDEPPAPSSGTPGWGRHVASPAAAHGVSRWGGWVSPVQIDGPVTITVLPARQVPVVRSLPRPVGLGPGPQPGVRSGEGVDFIGLRALADGEPARRVHWPTTLRTGNVVVTQTHQDTAGSYLVVLDGVASADHDELVRGVAGLCARLSRDGAHVGLAVLGSGDVAPVPLRPGGRHLIRLELALARARSRPGDPRNDHQHGRVRRMRMPPRTVVLAFTPLRDPATAALLARLAAAGHHVAALVGAGPADAAADPVAARLQLVERRVRMLRLEGRGIPSVEHGSERTALTTALARLDRRPRR
ncbi:MAG: DUF58 domain-containing protein [Dermatophilaceae bacterium]